MFRGAAGDRAHLRVAQGVGLTFGTAFCMPMAYRSGRFFHVQVPGVYGNGTVGILFSLFVVASRRST